MIKQLGSFLSEKLAQATSSKDMIANPAPTKPKDEAFGRYADPAYIEGEAKRLIKIMLQDNASLISSEPKNSDATKFLTMIGILKEGTNPFTVDEQGKPANEAVVHEPVRRNGTLMHTFNSASMRGCATPAMQKNADFLKQVSDTARTRPSFENLEDLLDRACPVWRNELAALEKLSQKKVDALSSPASNTPEIESMQDNRRLSSPPRYNGPAN